MSLVVSLERRQSPEYKAMKKEYDRQRRIRLKEKESEQRRQYYYAHKEQVNERCLRNYYANREEYIAKQIVTHKNIAWRIANREAVRKYNANLKSRLMNILNQYSCVRCGLSDTRLLAFDHIQGGGRSERKKLKGNKSTVIYYVHHPNEARQKLRVLCANCNWIVRDELHKGNRASTSYMYRLAVIAILEQDTCNNCGFSDKRALHIDHKDSDGYKIRDVLKYNDSVYRYYIKHPEEAKQKLQILCANCNWRKKIESGKAAYTFSAGLAPT